jgi:hypothetical protein
MIFSCVQVVLNTPPIRVKFHTQRCVTLEKILARRQPCMLERRQCEIWWCYLPSGRPQAGLLCDKPWVCLSCQLLERRQYEIWPGFQQHTMKSPFSKKIASCGCGQRGPRIPATSMVATTCDDEGTRCKCAHFHTSGCDWSLDYVST